MRCISGVVVHDFFAKAPILLLPLTCLEPQVTALLRSQQSRSVLDQILKEMKVWNPWGFFPRIFWMNRSGDPRSKPERNATVTVTGFGGDNQPNVNNFCFPVKQFQIGLPEKLLECFWGKRRFVVFVPRS